MAAQKVRPYRNVALLSPLVLPSAETVSRLLATWHAVQSRQFLWRKTDEPYAVLIAEILLRKTVADTVQEILPSFLARYPNPSSLALCHIDELEIALMPVGPSKQRAMQLRGLAESIQSRFHGQIPPTALELATLPGVGGYTARIVAATCFAIPEPAFDTNISRVILRVFDIFPTHAEARKSPNIWAAARDLVRSSNQPPAHVIWAVLDLASAICTRRDPRCHACPLREHCLYARQANAP